VIGDIAEKYISTRPLLLDVASEQAFDHVRGWIEDCQQHHLVCRSSERTPLPTRVLELTAADGSGAVRVYKTRGECERYAALSYCWGGKQSITLNQATQPQLETALQLELLPKTLQDAILVTMKLGMRFLWVDTLCIIQDSEEDRNRELKSMVQTYRNAFLTIAAASARSSRDGFLHKRTPRASKYPRFVLPYRAWDPEDGQSEPPPLGTVVLQEQFYHNPLEEPINNRAWTLQERLVSKRVIIYGTHELLWQCQNGQQIAGGIGFSFDAGSERLDNAFFDPAISISSKHLSISWEDVVIDYTHRETSFEEDKLVAMSAVASEFQRVAQGDKYLAGLWKRDLARGLLWIMDPCVGQTLRPRPSTYVAPSWSWASTNGMVTFGSSSEIVPEFEILHCDTTLDNPELPTGKVIAGFLEVRGPVRETAWAEPSTLLVGLDPNSKPIGRAFMDAEEDKPATVFCLRLSVVSGLVLVRLLTPSSPQQHNNLFKRIGVFEIHGTADIGPLKMSVCSEWFKGCETQTVIIR
jgi:hypothetical protein